MSKRCEGYWGVSCIDGSCPIASFEDYEERDYPIVHNCNECHLYEGCKDCAFAGTDICIKKED